MVSNFKPRPSKILNIADWSALLAISAAPVSIIVMPITVPKKPRIGIAQTITRNRP